MGVFPALFWMQVVTKWVSSFIGTNKWQDACFVMWNWRREINMLGRFDATFPLTRKDLTPHGAFNLWRIITHHLPAVCTVGGTVAAKSRHCGLSWISAGVNLSLCQRKESRQARSGCDRQRRFVGGGWTRMERLRGLEWKGRWRVLYLPLHGGCYQTGTWLTD